MVFDVPGKLNLSEIWGDELVRMKRLFRRMNEGGLVVGENSPAIKASYCLDYELKLQPEGELVEQLKVLIGEMLGKLEEQNLNFLEIRAVMMQAFVQGIDQSSHGINYIGFRKILLQLDLMIFEYLFSRRQPKIFKEDERGVIDEQITGVQAGSSSAASSII